MAKTVVKAAKNARGSEMRTNNGGPSRYIGLKMPTAILADYANCMRVQADRLPPRTNLQGLKSGVLKLVGIWITKVMRTRAVMSLLLGCQENMQLIRMSDAYYHINCHNLPRHLR